MKIYVGTIFLFQNYNLKSTLGERVIFLTEDDQINMKSEFVDHLPWNSFGRKNIGYIFAISQGAKIIFDFDDDNIIKFWIKDASIDPVMDIDNFNQNGGLCKTSDIILQRCYLFSYYCSYIVFMQINRFVSRFINCCS